MTKVTMATEIELKLELDAGAVNVLEKLKVFLTRLDQKLEFEKKQLENTYFDTPDKLLNHYRMALRIRKKGSVYIQTLKTKGNSVEGLSERGEWEWELPEPALELNVLEALNVWPEGMVVTSLMPVFETNFTRYTANIHWQDSQIELAFDEGEVAARNRAVPLLELELELRSGEVESLKTLSKALSEVISLRPSDISKAERGYALLQED